MIICRSTAELEQMREAGRLVGEVLTELASAVTPGISTADLDALAEKRIRQAGATPAFKGYHGYPASICASINDEVIHGIPSGRRLLKDGDVISIDVGVGYKGLNVLESAELRNGIKEYSNWPTIPQLYVKGEFIGGCDIIREMFQAGELQQMFADKGVTVSAAASA